MSLKKNNFQYAFVSFFLPTMLVFLAYLFMGIYPFGDNTILSMDLHGQYFPMISNLKTALKDGNFLYSFSSGLGFNLLSQGAYYTNSIFWYIIALLPAKLMIPAFHFIIAVKFGLSGLTFSYYLRKKHGENSVLGVALSCAYALSGYTLAYISQTMWTDAVILLPIVIIGLEIMLESGRPLAYFISLTLLLFSSFYIGFSVCIFVTLYFIVYELQDKRAMRARLERFGRFSLYSLLSGAASAIVLIPTYLTISRTKASSLGFEGELEIYHESLEFIKKLLPFSGNDLEFGPANIYCGAFVILSVLLYVFNNSLSIRKRLLHISLLSFLAISFELNLLDYIWHGFHYPNQLPARFSFLFIFLILIISYDAIKDIGKIKIPFVIASVILSVSFLLYFIITKESDGNTLIIGLVLLIAYSCIFLLTNFEQKQFAAVFAALIIVFEVGTNALYILGNETRMYSNNYYTFHYDEMDVLTEKYESKNDDFWRSESTPYLSFNSGQLFAHKGITYYSSMMSAPAYDFFGNLGFGIYAKNVSTLYSPTPIVNTMLGVKYVYDRYENSRLSTLEQKETHASTTVRENKYFLPVAFAVDEKMADFGKDTYSGPLDFQNEFLIATGATNDEVFHKLPHTEQTVNATVGYGSDGNKYFLRSDSGKAVRCDFSSTTDSDGDYYITSAFRAGTIKLYVNGQHQKDFSTSFHKVFFLGTFPAGTELKISVTSDYSYALYGIEFFGFDLNIFEHAYNSLLPGACDIISAAPTKIEADINVKENGLLYTSIPYDGGWNLYIDGERTEIIAIADFLCAAKIGAGEHTILFKYSPPGFYIGIAISLLDIFSVAAIEIHKKKK